MTVDLANQTVYLARGTLDLPEELADLRKTLLTHDNEVVPKDGSFWQPPKPAKYRLELFGERLRKQCYGELTSCRVHLVLPPRLGNLDMHALYTLALGHTDYLRVGHFMVRRLRPFLPIDQNTELSLADTDGLSTYVDGRLRAS